MAECENILNLCGERLVRQTTTTIRVEPGSELDRLFEHAEGISVELEWRGVRYRLTRVETPVPTKTAPSAEQLRRSIDGIRKATGGWKDLVDSDAFTAYIRQRRRTANRPSVKL